MLGAQSWRPRGDWWYHRGLVQRQPVWYVRHRAPGRHKQQKLEVAVSPEPRSAPPGLSADVNECLQLPEPCAYQCHNLQGSYRCLCPPGQVLLRDGKACMSLEQSGQNVTSVSHPGPSVSWLRPRTPIPGGSYHAWVSLRPGPRALSSVGRAWCPPGFIRQNGVCVGKARPCYPREHTPALSGASGLSMGHPQELMGKWAAGGAPQTLPC